LLKSGLTIGLLFVVIVLGATAGIAQTSQEMKIPEYLGICQTEGEGERTCYTVPLAGMDHATYGAFQITVKRFDAGGVLLISTTPNQTTTFTGTIDGSLIRGTTSMISAGEKRAGTWIAVLPPPANFLALANGPDVWWYCRDDVRYTNYHQPRGIRVMTTMFQRKELQSASIEAYMQKFDVFARLQVHAKANAVQYGFVGSAPICMCGVGRTVQDQHDYADVIRQTEITAGHLMSLPLLPLPWASIERAAETASPNK
jgi:hypothetical protein